MTSIRLIHEQRRGTGMFADQSASSPSYPLRCDTRPYLFAKNTESPVS